LEGSIECFSYLGRAIRWIHEVWVQNLSREYGHSELDSEGITDEMLSESQLSEAVREANLSGKSQQEYLAQLSRVLAGPTSKGGEEGPSKNMFGYEGLRERIIEYASVEPTAAMMNNSINLNLAYRVCLKVSRLVVTPVDAVVHASSQVVDYEAEQKRIRSKLRGFPTAYLEQNGETARLEETAVFREADLAQLNEAFEEWVISKKGMLDCAIFPLNNSSIEDLGDGFRLTLRMEVREKTTDGFANPHKLPDLKIDFSSLEEAKYAEEAFFEILLRQKKETMRDRVGRIIDSLLNVKSPARKESLIGILEAREIDLKKERAITNIISELRRIYDPTWDDLDNLRKRLAKIRRQADLRVS
jgi:hypothetical protein